MMAARVLTLLFVISAALAGADGYYRRRNSHRARSAREARLLRPSLIKVEILYEALCPFCKSYLTDQVTRTMRSELGKFVDLHLFPYGNAADRDGSVVCQHGIEECRLNILSACGIKKIQGKPDSLVAFIECVEGLDSASDGKWRDCLSVSGRHKGEIEACFQGDEGQRLLKAIGNVSRRHYYTYVPWVIVNGSHSASSEANLTLALCEALGTGRPHICSTLSEAGAFSFLDDRQRCLRDSPSLL